MELNLTQKGLARRLAVGTGSIYKYENELMMPGTKVLEKIKNLCTEETLTEPLKLLSNFNIDTEEKEDVGMDAKYLISLQRDKIEYQEEKILKLKTTLENKQAESTHWDALPYDFISDVTLKRKGLKFGRIINSVSDLDGQSEVLGYSIKTLEKYWSIGTFYNFKEHPIDKIVAKETVKEIDKQMTTLPYIFDSIKSMVGDHYIPQPLVYVHKNGKHIGAIAFAKVRWRTLRVTAKVQFLVHMPRD